MSGSSLLFCRCCFKYHITPVSIHICCHFHLLPCLMEYFLLMRFIGMTCYKSVPEISITSFCGVECKSCSQYLEKNVQDVVLKDSKYQNCEVLDAWQKRYRIAANVMKYLIVWHVHRTPGVFYFKARFAWWNTRVWSHARTNIFCKKWWYEKFLDT